MLLELHLVVINQHFPQWWLVSPCFTQSHFIPCNCWQLSNCCSYILSLYFPTLTDCFGISFYLTPLTLFLLSSLPLFYLLHHSNNLLFPILFVNMAIPSFCSFYFYLVHALHYPLPSNPSKLSLQYSSTFLHLPPFVLQDRYRVELLEEYGGSSLSSSSRPTRLTWPPSSLWRGWFPPLRAQRIWRSRQTLPTALWTLARPKSSSGWVAVTGVNGLFSSR